MSTKKNSHPGPRTAEGKAKSAMNALKSGIYANSTIIPGEDPKQLEALKAEYYDRFAPPVPEERCLLDQIIHNEWLMRRFRRIEADLMEYRMNWFSDPSDHVLGEAYEYDGRTLSRLQRRITETEKSYLCLLKELRTLQAARKAEEAMQSQWRQSHPAPDHFVPQPVASSPLSPVEPAPICVPDPQTGGLNEAPVL